MADYFAKTSGNDSHAGTSDSTAWATLAKFVSAASAGDALNLNGGDSFAESLALKDTQTVRSYGTGQATLNPGSGSDGITGVNVAGVTIQNVIVKGKNGVHLTCNDSAVSRRAGPSIIGCDIQALGTYDGDVNASGVLLDFAPGTQCWTGIGIVENTIHDCPGFGVVICHQATGPYAYINDLTEINDNEVFNCGNSCGIFVGLDESDASIGANYVHDCGALNTADNGPVGIILVGCKAAFVSNNECARISAGTGGDGDGFDLDGNCVNCIMEYNYSHECDGAGFLLFGIHDFGPETFSGNICRFNLSINDSRKLADAGGIRMSNNGGGSKVYNNTVVMSSVPVDPGGAIVIQSGDTWEIYNNNLVVPEGINAVRYDDAGVSNVSVQEGNNYCSGGQFLVYDSHANVTYTSLAAFRTATGFENHGGTPRGSVYYPMFQVLQGTELGTSPFDGTQQSNTYYTLAPQSPLNGAGLDLSSLFSIDPGAIDFAGLNLRSPYSVGCYDAPGSGVGVTSGPMRTFADNFQRSDGAVGNSWADPSSISSISGDKLRIAYSSGDNFIHRPSGENILNSRVLATTGTLTASGLQYRISVRDQNSHQNLWQLVWQPDASNTTGILRVVAGSGSWVNQTTESVTAGHNYQLMLEATAINPTFVRGIITDLTAGTTLYDSGFNSDNTSGLQTTGNCGIGAGNTLTFTGFSSVQLDATASFYATESSLAPSATGTLSLVGSATLWTQNNPVLSVSGGTVSSTTVVDDTHITLVVSAGSGTSLVVADDSTLLAVQIPLRSSPPPSSPSSSQRNRTRSFAGRNRGRIG